MGSLTRLLSWPLISIGFSALTFIIIFILSGISLYYFCFHRHQAVIHDLALLTSVGLVVSIFFIPFLLFLADLVLPIHYPLVLSFIYIALLLLPYLRKPLPLFTFAPLSQSHFLKQISHPALLAFVLIITTILVCLNQYSFLLGLDAYTWLMKYEISLDHQLYDLSSGVNRVLFSTLVAVFYRLTNLPLFSVFKYWFPLLSLLPIIPLWLIARTFSNRCHQFIFLSSLLISPAIIIDWQTTRHHQILLLFLYLSLGLLFTTRRYHQPALFQLTFVASFIGILYHPFFLILVLFWLFAGLIIHRPFIIKHPIGASWFILLFFITAHFLHLSSLFRNIYFRIKDSTFNFFTLNWNLAYPASYISEGAQMGWPGFIGVIKYYAYYAGPLPLLFLLTIFILLIFVPTFRNRFWTTLFSPYLLPLSLFLFLMLFLAEILTRFANIAYLPDRAWLLGSLLTTMFLPFIFSPTTSRRLNLFFIPSFVIALLITVSGTFYINHAFSFTIPDYELTAAAWMREHLPVSSYVFTSSSKNVLRYYARVKLLRMEPGIIYSNYPQPILSRINEFRDIIDPAHTYIYYAVTDPRNPFIERQYVSSYTQARPTSIFPALSSNPDHFELIYSEPNLVYLWRIK